MAVIQHHAKMWHRHIENFRLKTPNNRDADLLNYLINLVYFALNSTAIDCQAPLNVGCGKPQQVIVLCCIVLHI